MPVIETVLIYLCIPLGVVLVFAALTLIPGHGKDSTHYRPGQPWPHPAVWYEPHPDTAGVHGGDAGDGHPERPGLGATAAALAIGAHPHGQQVSDGAGDGGPRRTAAGGARGTW